MLRWSRKAAAPEPRLLVAPLTGLGKWPKTRREVLPLHADAAAAMAEQEFSTVPQLCQRQAAHTSTASPSARWRRLNAAWTRRSTR